MLIGRVARGGSKELDLGGDKRRTNKCDVILNPSHCKILATLLDKSISFLPLAPLSAISDFHIGHQLLAILHNQNSWMEVVGYYYF